ncbi:SGNH/GDSL hydrolase family protein [Modestobacter sp. Leaf380]|uniref:SGNH/GDSL hydrolase family protein n=1 Tax=Modestobacter sp. Leaf380 TaxID=1736356 RepID=UPI0006FF5A0F|nr:SGNH/GDSL hydrolase family protein [Modestobacter sp. Leaf380]KQS72147.1 GDSL family lipase [Modestobacter sp. Leaf380]
MSLSLVVLGDSIAFGTGAAVPADAIGPRLVRALAEDGVDAALQVVAVPGATSAGLATQVRQVTRAHLALVVVGSNDLTRLVPPATAARQLGDAVRDLRLLGADVLVVPAPDLSTVPWVPPSFQAMVSTASGELRRQQTEAVRAAGGVAVPIGEELGQRFRAQPALFSADRFHPSSSGYALIAEALLPVVRSIARARDAA